MLQQSAPTKMLGTLAALALAGTLTTHSALLLTRTALAESISDTTTRNAVSTASPQEVSSLRLSYRYLNETQRRAYRQVLSSIQDKTYTSAIARISFEDLDHAFSALRQDYPELFWVRSYHYLQKGSGYTLWVDTPNMSQKEVCAIDAKLQGLANSFLESLPEGACAYDKAKAAYEWVALNTTYDEGAHANQNITSALLDRRAVCAGYAAAFTYLCQKAGLPATTVSGEVISSAYKHSWNLIEIDGIPTYVDVTFGDVDTVSGNAKKSEEVNFGYLSLTSEEIFRDRSLKFADTLPTCSNPAFDFFRLKSRYFLGYQPQKILCLISDALAAGSHQVDFKLDSRAAYQRTKDALNSGEINVFSLTGKSPRAYYIDGLRMVRITW